MKWLISLSFCLCLIPGLHAGVPETFKEAQALGAQGKFPEAIAAYEKAAQEAEAAGLTDTVFRCHYQASYDAYRGSLNADCLRLAEAAIRVFESNPNQPWTKDVNRKINRIEMVGFCERVYSFQQRLGLGWSQNTRAIQFLRQLARLPETEQGLTPSEVAGMPPHLRRLGWRLIEREATYLYDTGRSAEARKLLQDAVEAASPDLKAGTYDRSFYPTKLLGKLGTIEGFIGYEEKARQWYEQELQSALQWNTSRPNLLRIQMNILDTRTDIEGTSEESIREADQILAKAKEKGYSQLPGFQRLHTSIAAKKLSREDRIHQLVDAASASRASENEIEHFYSSRNALFERAARNDPELDAEFHRFLSETRENGKLRSEPRIYRRYGDWLRGQQRQTEALRIYREALQMTTRFGWHPLVPGLMAKIGAAHMEAGQPEEAQRIWDEIKHFLDRHPDVPALSRIQAHRIILNTLLRFGRIEEARTLAERWEAYGKAEGVADYWMAALSSEFIDAYVKKSDGPAEARTSSAGSSVLLYPQSVTTASIPGQPAVAAFFLLNSGSQSGSGTLTLAGPGLQRLENEGRLVYQVTPGSGSNTVEEPLTLEAGTFDKIRLLASASSPDRQNDPTPVALSWSGGTESTWNYGWGEDADSVTVLDAALLDWNPFIGMPVEHHFYTPADPTAPTPFRLRSEIPLRVEYRDSLSGELIAVDQNGNGNFSDSGDFWTPNGESSIQAPLLPKSEQHRQASIELWIFPNGQPTQDTTIHLHAEIHLDGHWQTQAINEINL